MGVLELVITAISLLALIFLLGILFVAVYALMFGAPYAPLSQNRIDTMFELLKLKKGQRLVDLGSGDGRIVITAAKLGFEARGYEINPVLVLISRIKIRKSGLEKKAQIHLKDFWSSDLKTFDGVTVYGIAHMMGRLEKKLLRELRPGSKIVTNHFKLPHSKSLKTRNDVFYYEVGTA